MWLSQKKGLTCKEPLPLCFYIWNHSCILFFQDALYAVPLGIILFSIPHAIFFEATAISTVIGENHLQFKVLKESYYIIEQIIL